MPKGKPVTDTKMMVRFYLPTSLVAEVNLLLFSGAEGRIPHGEVSCFYERLVREYLMKLREARQQTQINLLENGCG